MISRLFGFMLFMIGIMFGIITNILIQLSPSTELANSEHMLMLGSVIMVVIGVLVAAIGSPWDD